MDIIIQARTTSTRLPQKVIHRLHDGKMLLELEIERLKLCKNINNIILATTINKTDDILEELSKKMGIKIFRGDEDNVLERYYLAAKKYDSKYIIRITGDCPFIDPEIIDKMIELYYENESKIDYLSNVIERTYPRGLDVEILSMKILEKIYNEARTNIEKEHVTTYIHKNKEKFKIENYANNIDYSKYRLTVDTKEDFKLIYKLYEILGKYNFGFLECIKVLENNPKLLGINCNIKQKEY